MPDPSPTVSGGRLAEAALWRLIRSLAKRAGLPQADTWPPPGAEGDSPFEQGFDIRLWPDWLGLPLRWRKPRRVPLNSMSDLSHDAVPDEFIVAVDNDVLDVADRAARALGWCWQASRTGLHGDAS